MREAGVWDASPTTRRRPPRRDLRAAAFTEWFGIEVVVVEPSQAMRADLPMPAWWPATPNAIPLAGRQPPPRGTHPCSCSRGRVPGRPRQTPRAARIQTGPLDMLVLRKPVLPGRKRDGEI